MFPNVRRRALGADVPDEVGDDAAQQLDGSAAPVLVAPPSVRELVDSAVAMWRGSLVETSGASALADINQLGEAVLDLTAAHPSGIAQLFAGRPTRLTNLVREGASLGSARRRARAVCAQATSYEQSYGMAAAYLAIGVATWTERGGPDVAVDDVSALATATGHDGEPSAHASGEYRVVRAPVLLRPVNLSPLGAGDSDHELTIEPTVELNPILVRALRSRGALLDPASLARSTFTESGFDPRPALARISSLGAAVLEGFEHSDRVLVGTFVHPGQTLVDDLDAMAASLDRHEIIAAIAGDESALAAVKRELPDPLAGDRDPAMERGAGDLDPVQQYIVDQVAAGTSLFIDAPSGADSLGMVAALAADAAASGRRVLVVPGHRHVATALAAHMETIGLGDLLLDVAPEAGWRSTVAGRLVGAMTAAPEQIDADRLGALRRDLVAHRETLRRYVEALHAVQPGWDLSVYDALQSLADLTATRPAPRTTVRLDARVAREMDSKRRAWVSRELARAAELGAFSRRPGESAWSGAAMIATSQALDAIDRVTRLLDVHLPKLATRMAQVAHETGLTPVLTLDAWGEQLGVLDGVRSALDVFQPMIFERSAADMVAATAGKGWRDDNGQPMGRWLRRRLRKQAKDLLRPGRHVDDLHAALAHAQAQRQVWQEHCPAGGWPRLPDGMATITQEYSDLRADLDVLDAILAPVPWPDGQRASLAATSLDALVTRLERLRQDSDSACTIAECEALLRSVRSAGASDLVDDLVARHVDVAVVASELELAWWSTVLEQLLATDDGIAGYDGEALSALADRYVELDRDHVASLAVPVRASVVGHARSVMAAHPDEATSLFAELIEDRMTSVRDTMERHPDVAGRLRPVVVSAAMVVPQVLPAARTTDLVILDAVGHLPTEALLAAIGRARQIVVLGDERSAAGSAVRDLAEVLPHVSLRADSSRRDPYLTAFLAEHGYADVLRPLPVPDPRGLVSLHVVDGTGMPDVTSGVVESPLAEVERVVELVIEQAVNHPGESLAVVTASPLHAERVREAVMAEARDSAPLAVFVSSNRPEAFHVTDLESVAGLQRDAVILSIGYGRTPHGRVLYRFGALARPGGDGLLRDAIGASRQRLTLVSSMSADALEPERLRGEGPRLLAELLTFAAQRTADAALPMDPRGSEPAVEAADEPDRLVVDIAERLWRQGFMVDVDHGLAQGWRVPLAVGHPDRPNQMLVAVLTDDEAYVNEPSVRVRDRLRRERLERLGWKVVQVWSAAAFLDPQAEVERVARAVWDQLAVLPPLINTQTSTIPVMPVRVMEWDDDDDVAAPTADVADDRTGVDAATAADAVAATDAVIGADAETGAGVSNSAGVANGAGVTTSAGVANGARMTTNVGVAPASGAKDAAGRRSAPRTAAPFGGAAAEQPELDFAADGDGATGGGDVAIAAAPRQRPAVTHGLPIAAYSDDELDELVQWILVASPPASINASPADASSTDAALVRVIESLRLELGITRHSARIDAVLTAAARRGLGL